MYYSDRGCWAARGRGGADGTPLSDFVEGRR
jgi:hypothetical protein